MKTYKELQTELDELMSQLQDDSTDIEQAMQLHAAAQKCIAQMQKRLDEFSVKLEKV